MPVCVKWSALCFSSLSTTKSLIVFPSVIKDKDQEVGGSSALLSSGHTSLSPAVLRSFSVLDLLSFFCVGGNDSDVAVLALLTLSLAGCVGGFGWRICTVVPCQLRCWSLQYTAHCFVKSLSCWVLLLLCPRDQYRLCYHCGIPHDLCVFWGNHSQSVHNLY